MAQNRRQFVLNYITVMLINYPNVSPTLLQPTKDRVFKWTEVLRD